MKRDFDKAVSQKYDLIVVGGGINGAAVSHLAAKEGLKVILIEKGDFAEGASSKSTKLIHGGIRYLENLELGLVRESIKERYIQLKAAPHLVKVIPFVIPLYNNDIRKAWLMKLGVSIYDCLAGKYSVGKHGLMSKDEIIKLVPGIKEDGLKGGIIYYDCQMDDSRLCLENVLSARENGAHTFNYVEALSFITEKRMAKGLTVRDNVTTRIFNIYGDKILCAAGPWANKVLKMEDTGYTPRIWTTKGVHIVYNGRFSDYAILLSSQRDGRIFFIIPFGQGSLIGTTDTIYTNSPDKVSVEDDDIRYLVENTKRVLPSADFREDKIVNTFAGLRPLVGESKNPSKASRKHKIFETDKGVFYIIGGKYTTYRKIAADFLLKVFDIHVSGDFSLYGGGENAINISDKARALNISDETISYLTSKYGSRAADLVRIVEEDVSMGEKICDCSLAIKAQLLYSSANEMAITASDIFYRRLGLQNLYCKNRNCYRKISEFIAHYRSG